MIKKKYNKILKIKEVIGYDYNSLYNIFFFRNLNGYFKVFMPSFFFIKKIKLKYFFLFLNKFNFFSIYKQFIRFYNMLYKFFFFKLRLRGLGYRIKNISKYLYRFFFAFNHYFYFYISNDIFVRHYKRNMLIFSNNKQKLNDIFIHLLLLKKLDFYERTNSFIVLNKILLLKKRK